MLMVPPVFQPIIQKPLPPTISTILSMTSPTPSKKLLRRLVVGSHPTPTDAPQLLAHLIASSVSILLQYPTDGLPSAGQQPFIAILPCMCAVQVDGLSLFPLLYCSLCANTLPLLPSPHNVSPPYYHVHSPSPHLTSMSLHSATMSPHLASTHKDTDSHRHEAYLVEVHDGGRRPKYIDVINTNIYYRKIPTVT